MLVLGAPAPWRDQIREVDRQQRADWFARPDDHAQPIGHYRIDGDPKKKNCAGGSRYGVETI